VFTGRQFSYVFAILILSLFSVIVIVEIVDKTRLSDPEYDASQSEVKAYNQEIPTVFIHGWKGSERSFRTMFNRLSAHYHGPERAFVVRIDPDSSVTVSGNMKNKRIPLIQILFTDNHASMEQQGIWLRSAFRVLKTKGIDRMNVVSHSMGGKAFTCYLETARNPDAYPKTEKFVAIAAPFDWIGGPNKTDFSLDQLKSNSALYKYRARIPRDLHVLAIAGVNNRHTESDGVVRLQSAFFGKYFFNPEYYSEKIIYGRNAQHSKLHENPAVDQLIADYLWKIKPKG
jgi:uncharacterized alpha/beta hydrolase family protein